MPYCTKMNNKFLDLKTDSKFSYTRYRNISSNEKKTTGETVWGVLKYADKNAAVCRPEIY